MRLEPFAPGLPRRKCRFSLRDDLTREKWTRSMEAPLPAMCHPRVPLGRPLFCVALPQAQRSSRRFGTWGASEDGDSEGLHPCPAQPSRTLLACFCLIRSLGLGHLAQETAWVNTGSCPAQGLQASGAGPKAQASWALTQQGQGLSGNGGHECSGSLNWGVQRAQLWRLGGGWFMAANEV